MPGNLILSKEMKGEVKLSYVKSERQDLVFRDEHSLTDHVHSLCAYRHKV